MKSLDRQTGFLSHSNEEKKMRDPKEKDSQRKRIEMKFVYCSAVVDILVMCHIC